MEDGMWGIGISSKARQRGKQKKRYNTDSNSSSISCFIKREKKEFNSIPFHTKLAMNV